MPAQKPVLQMTSSLFVKLRLKILGQWRAVCGHLVHKRGVVLLYERVERVSAPDGRVRNERRRRPAWLPCQPASGPWLLPCMAPFLIRLAGVTPGCLH